MAPARTPGRIDRLDGQTDRAHHQWERHHAGRHRRAGPLERQHDAKPGIEKAADRTTPAKYDQQQIPRDDRRHDQRQMDNAIEQLLARKAPARQRQRNRDAER